MAPPRTGRAPGRDAAAWLASALVLALTGLARAQSDSCGGAITGATGGGTDWNGPYTITEGSEVNPGERSYVFRNVPSYMDGGVYISSSPWPRGNDWSWTIEYTAPAKIYIWERLDTKTTNLGSMLTGDGWTTEDTGDFQRFSSGSTPLQLQAWSKEFSTGSQVSYAGISGLLVGGVVSTCPPATTVATTLTTTTTTTTLTTTTLTTTTTTTTLTTTITSTSTTTTVTTTSTTLTGTTTSTSTTTTVTTTSTTLTGTTTSTTTTTVTVTSTTTTITITTTSMTVTTKTSTLTTVTMTGSSTSTTVTSTTTTTTTVTGTSTTFTTITATTTSTTTTRTTTVTTVTGTTTTISTTTITATTTTTTTTTVTHTGSSSTVTTSTGTTTTVTTTISTTTTTTSTTLTTTSTTTTSSTGTTTTVTTTISTTTTTTSTTLTTTCTTTTSVTTTTVTTVTQTSTSTVTSRTSTSTTVTQTTTTTSSTSSTVTTSTTCGTITGASGGGVAWAGPAAVVEGGEVTTGRDYEFRQVPDYLLGGTYFSSAPWPQGNGWDWTITYLPPVHIFLFERDDAENAGVAAALEGDGWTVEEPHGFHRSAGSDSDQTLPLRVWSKLFDDGSEVVVRNLSGLLVGGAVSGTECHGPTTTSTMTATSTTATTTTTSTTTRTATTTTTTTSTVTGTVTTTTRTATGSTTSTTTTTGTSTTATTTVTTATTTATTVTSTVTTITGTSTTTTTTTLTTTSTTVTSTTTTSTTVTSTTTSSTTTATSTITSSTSTGTSTTTATATQTTTSTHTSTSTTTTTSSLEEVSVFTGSATLVVRNLRNYADDTTLHAALAEGIAGAVPSVTREMVTITGTRSVRRLAVVRRAQAPTQAQAQGVNAPRIDVTYEVRVTTATAASAGLTAASFAAVSRPTYVASLNQALAAASVSLAVVDVELSEPKVEIVMAIHGETPTAAPPVELGPPGTLAGPDFVESRASGGWIMIGLMAVAAAALLACCLARLFCCCCGGGKKAGRGRFDADAELGEARGPQCEARALRELSASPPKCSASRVALEAPARDFEAFGVVASESKSVPEAERRKEQLEAVCELPTRARRSNPVGPLGTTVEVKDIVIDVDELTPSTESEVDDVDDFEDDKTPSREVVYDLDEAMARWSFNNIQMSPTTVLPAKVYSGSLPACGHCSPTETVCGDGQGRSSGPSTSRGLPQEPKAGFDWVKADEADADPYAWHDHALEI